MFYDHTPILKHALHLEADRVKSCVGVLIEMISFPLEIQRQFATYKDHCTGKLYYSICYTMFAPSSYVVYVYLATALLVACAPTQQQARQSPSDVPDFVLKYGMSSLLFTNRLRC
jgi:hypothetical protein